MAVRIVGVDLPQNKRGEIALTYIFGIGRSAAKDILEKAGVDVNIKVKDWTDAQAAKVREVIGANYKVEGDLRSEIQLNIKRLMDIGCYRGIRHRIGLPVRGQSTKNNARTRTARSTIVFIDFLRPRSFAVTTSLPSSLITRIGLIFTIEPSTADVFDNLPPL